MTTDRFWDERMETLPLKRLRILREHRLAWQLRRCWDASPFYRERLAGVGLDPAAAIRTEAWQRLAPLHAADLPTGPSSARPSDAWAVAPAAWRHGAELAGTLPARALTDGDLIQQADLAVRALWAAGLRPGRPRSSPGVSAHPTWQPAIDAGMARIDAAGARPTPTDPGAVAVPWSDTWPASLAGRPSVGALGIPFAAPTVAYGCGESGTLHWLDDHFLVEVVDPATGEALPAGRDGAVAITDLTREGSPLLRYWTGLRSVLDDEPCRCGRTSATSPFVRPLA